MEKRKHNYASLLVCSLEDFKTIESCFNSEWFFRGQQCSSWDLETSMERPGSGLQRSEYAAFEKNSLMEVCRLLEWDANSGDDFSRLAFLQHHGCRTRLLDFTSCLNVALYFASQIGSFEENGKSTSDAAIWAISKSALEKKVQALRDYPGKKIADISRDLIQKSIHQGADAGTDDALGVVFCKPALPNPRIVAQKGLFLAPLNLQNDFKTNLTRGLNLTGSKDPVRRLSSIDDLSLAIKEEDVIKLILRHEIRSELLNYLSDKGIDDNTLFPSAEEFAKNLNEWRPRKSIVI